MCFKINMPVLKKRRKEFSISSQHYDFLPPLMTEFSIRYPENKNFRIFESTTVQILDEVAQGHSELGIIYLNRQNTKGIMQRVDKLGLEVVDLIPFQTHIYLRKGHPLAKKKKTGYGRSSSVANCSFYPRKR